MINSNFLKTEEILKNINIECLYYGIEIAVLLILNNFLPEINAFAKEQTIWSVNSLLRTTSKLLIMQSTRKFWIRKTK